MKDEDFANKCITISLLLNDEIQRADINNDKLAKTRWTKLYSLFNQLVNETAAFEEELAWTKGRNFTR